MSSQTGAADLCWASGKPFPLEPQVSRLHNQTASFSLSEGSAEGHSCSALEGKPRPWNSSLLLVLGIPSFLGKRNRIFPW